VDLAKSLMRGVAVLLVVSVVAVVITEGRDSEGSNGGDTSGGGGWADVALGPGTSILSLDSSVGGWNSDTQLPPVPVGTPELPSPDEPEDGGGPVVPVEVTDQAVTPVLPGRTDIERLVAGYPWDAGRMTRIMYCESGGRPDAISPGGHRGLFQLATGWASGNPDYWTRWMEPEYNIALAYYVWTRQGYAAWSCR
jgi:hypothetical protein